MADQKEEPEVGTLYQLHTDKKGNYALYLDSEKLVESENGAGPYQYIVAQKKLPNADTKTEQKKLLKEWIGEAQDAEKL